jgi:hypothetical protein
MLRQLVSRQTVANMQEIQKAGTVVNESGFGQDLHAPINVHRERRAGLHHYESQLGLCAGADRSFQPFDSPLQIRHLVICSALWLRLARRIRSSKLKGGPS